MTRKGLSVSGRAVGKNEPKGITGPDGGSPDKGGHGTPGKVCNACHRFKTSESFYRYHRNKDGRLNICKRCFLARQARYREAT